MADSESASAASSKVQEVAANMQELAGKRKRHLAQPRPRAVARRYFEAIDARDLDAAVALWAEGGRENVRGQLDVLAPEGVRAFIGEHAGRASRTCR